MALVLLGHCCRVMVECAAGICRELHSTIVDSLFAYQSTIHTVSAVTLTQYPGNLIVYRLLITGQRMGEYVIKTTTHSGFSCSL